VSHSICGSARREVGVALQGDAALGPVGVHQLVVALDVVEDRLDPDVAEGW
jgi:hypothetical protein